MANVAQFPLTVKISAETSKQLVNCISESGSVSPEAISQFIEETVSRRIFQIKTQKVRERFSDKTPEQIEKLVEEALAWARSTEGRACE